MREKRPVWFGLTVGLLLFSAGYAAHALYGYDAKKFWLSIVLLFVSAVLFLISFYLFSQRNIRFIAKLNDEIASTEHETMYSLPVPTVILDDSGLILWYNLLFGREILENDDVFGLRISEVLNLDFQSLLATGSGEVHYCDKQYDISVTTCTRNDKNLHLLCFTDVTDYAALQDTFLNTRPTVMLLVIDNYEDVLQNAKESEKATVFAAIEQMLERFMAPTTGVLRRLSSDRFVAVVEEQHLQQMIKGRFRILDDARTITVGERYAITLSIGEKERASYQAYFDAGANRYLLRHETAAAEHYAQLHPASMSLANRKRCLFDLKEIGYQVGSGFMVGSPYQTPQNLLADMRFLQQLEPDMIGIGPYITHEQTPFADKKSGTLEQTLRLLSMLRLLFPYALLPATTALGTIHPNGRELGLKAGGNVVMPNLSPKQVRDKYALYDGKICTGDEAAEYRNYIERRINLAGYEVEICRGDSVIKKEQMKVGDNDE